MSSLKKNISLFLAFPLFLLCYNCTKQKGKINYGEFPEEIGSIMANKCATSGCHNSKSSSIAGGYNLESWESMFKGGSNGSPVIPFNSNFSSLCFYINTYQELGLQNNPTMPLNGKALSFNEVKLIKYWIDAGAPNLNGEIKWQSSARKKLYAVNQGCDVVTVFDAESQLPIRVIPVGTKSGPDTPHNIRVSGDGKYYYVLFINNNILQKFSTSDNTLIANIPLSPLAAGTGTADAFDWNTIVLTKDSKKAYCVSWQTAGKVACVDLVNHKLLHFVGGMYNPHGIALSNDEKNIYITAQFGNCLFQFDTAFTVSNKYSLDGLPPNEFSNTINSHELVVGKNPDEMIVTCQKSNDIRVFNTLTNTVTTIIPSATDPTEIIYSSQHNCYFITHTEDTLSFSNSRGSVTKLNATDYSMVKLKCGYQPHGLAIDKTSNLLYVLSRNRNTQGPAPHHTSNCIGRNGFVSFINLQSFTLLNKSYELSVDPYTIRAQP